MIFSARRNIASPSLDRSDRPDAPLHFKNLADKLDVDVLYVQGTDAARLALAHQINGGLFFWTTDTHVLYYDDGAAWWIVSSDLTAAVLKSLIDAKGDIIAGTADNTVARLPVGADSSILIADSSQASGLKWINRDWTPVTQAASFGSADAPASTYVMNIVGVDLTTAIRPATRIHVVQTTDKYFIVTASAFTGGNTVVTMFGGTDFALANAAITVCEHSNRRFPVGFSTDPTKWNVRVVDGTDRTTANPTQSAWVFPSAVLSIVVPIGAWELGYQTHCRSNYSAGQGQLSDEVTLSQSTTLEDDADFSAMAYVGDTANTHNKLGFEARRVKEVILATKATYNLLAKANDPTCTVIGFYGTTAGKSVLTAKNLYY